MELRHKKPHGHPGKRGHVHGGRFLQIDQYAARSGLFGVNPDLKVLVGVISLILCVISGRGITSVMIGFCMVFVTVGMGKAGGAEYIRFLRIPCSFIFLSGMVLLVDISGTRLGFVDIPVGSWYLSVTKASLGHACLVSIRALAGLTCLYMISLNTPLYEIIGVLRRAHVPEIMIELMYLIYRFLFILLDSYENMKNAAQARGGYCSIKRAYASFFGICGNLLAVAFGKASRSFDAMESRGYDGTLVFLETKKSVTGKQAALAAMYLAAAAALFLAEWRFL